MKKKILEGHFRHILLLLPTRENAAQAHQKLCGVYRDECNSNTAVYLSEIQCQNWFVRLLFGNFDVKYEPVLGRTIVEKKVDRILNQIGVERHISPLDITAELNIDQKQS